jgi:hypothetical protein
MSWIVTVHSAMGSMGEAAESFFTVQAPDRDTAADVAAMLQRVIRDVAKHEELWATWGPIDAATGSASDDEIKENFKKVLVDRFGS